MNKTDFHAILDTIQDACVTAAITDRAPSEEASTPHEAALINALGAVDYCTIQLAEAQCALALVKLRGCSELPSPFVWASSMDPSTTNRLFKMCRNDADRITLGAALTLGRDRTLLDDTNLLAVLEQLRQEGEA